MRKCERVKRGCVRVGVREGGEGVCVWWGVHNLSDFRGNKRFERGGGPQHLRTQSVVLENTFIETGHLFEKASLC